MGMTKFVEHLPFEVAQVIGKKARIGMVVLASDYTIEHEFRRIFTPRDHATAQQFDGLDVFYARIQNSPDISPETLRAMGPKITHTAELLLPNDRLDVLGFACTSASVVLGSDAVAHNLNAAKPEALTTDPAVAATTAMHAMGLRRVAVLTPYITEINKKVAERIESAGIEVPIFGSFNEPMDPVVAAITTQSLLGAMRALVAEQAVDGIFVSCTSVRMAEEIPALEQELGLPIISSNLALAWHVTRLGGVQEPIMGLGRLFECPLIA